MKKVGMEKENNTSAQRRLEKAVSFGNLWIYILSLCGKKAVYAYCLRELIMERFGFCPSRLMGYLVLYKLEAEGLISSKFVKRRKYYEATKKGKKALSWAKKHLGGLSKKL